MVSPDSFDYPSYQGKFGWMDLKPGNKAMFKFNAPYILRKLKNPNGDGYVLEKFVSVRILYKRYLEAFLVS